jgi:hypothetical protein
LRKRRDSIPSGMAQRDEREQTADDLSKAYIGDVETGEKSLTRDKSGGRPDCCPDDIRHEGGVKLSWALAWNVGTCVPMRREKSKWEAPIRMRVPKRSTGAEQPVLGLRAL